MNNKDIGLRAQDIQAGLQDVSMAGPAAGVFDRTLLVGMAERLAIHIRGIDVIDDPERLRAVAGRLGIDSLVLPRVLSVLEEAGFASVQYSGEDPQRVVERVPYFGSIYERLGEIWQARAPREEEVATVELLHRLADAPESLAELTRTTGLDDAQTKLVLNVGKAGGYVAEFETDDGEPVIYSPLYWEENPEETYRLLGRWGGEKVAEAIRTVRAYQGRPLVNAADGATETDKIVLEAMVAGLLPSPEVHSVNGPKRFAFTPYHGQIGLEAHERAILQKARAILSCIRYGQHFGGVTRVVDPTALINSLRTRGSIGPHSEIARQYATLVVEGIARIAPDTTYRSRYHLHLIDTDENKKALRLALELLAVGEAISDRGLDSETRGVLFGPGTVRDAATTRSDEIARRGRAPTYDAALIRRELAKLIEHVREPV